MGYIYKGTEAFMPLPEVIYQYQIFRKAKATVTRRDNGKLIVQKWLEGVYSVQRFAAGREAEAIGAAESWIEKVKEGRNS